MQSVLMKGFTYLCIPMGNPPRQYREQNRIVSPRERKLGCCVPTLVSSWLRVAPEALMGLDLLHFAYTKQAREREKTLIERNTESHSVLGSSRNVTERGQGPAAKMTQKGVDTKGCFDDCTTQVDHKEIDFSPCLNTGHWNSYVYFICACVYACIYIYVCVSEYINVCECVCLCLGVTSFRQISSCTFLQCRISSLVAQILVYERLNFIPRSKTKNLLINLQKIGQIA